MTLSRRDPTILLALVVALGVHLALIGFGMKVARRDLGWWLAKPAAPAETQQQAPIIPPDMQELGDHDTHGQSINSAQGDRPMESALADARQEQAAVQRDPEGYGGHGTNRLLDQTLRGDNGDNSQPGSNAGGHSASAVFGSRESSVADLAPKAPAPPVAKAAPSQGQSQGQAAIDPLSSGPMKLDKPASSAMASANSAATASAPPAQQQTAQSQGGAASAAGGIGGTAGAPDSGAGNPIPSSDFESYPVKHVASQFVAGRIEAQIGRQFKIRRQPDLGEAAIGDVLQLDEASVVLLLTIDISGNVSDAQIKHTSGSDYVDLACQRAAYTWWFEPFKDPATGAIHSQQIEFTIRFR